MGYDVIIQVKKGVNWSVFQFPLWDTNGILLKINLTITLTFNSLYGIPVV